MPRLGPDSITDAPADGPIAVLRKDEAISVVMSALKVLQIGYVETDVLRVYATDILRVQQGRRYRYEDPIDEIVEDLVWLMR